MTKILRLFLGLVLVWQGCSVAAQPQGEIVVSTVTRPPFSMVADGVDTGFSIDLLNAAAKELGLSVRYDRTDSFGQMLSSVQNGQVDGAIANISITAERERIMDFSQPIFEAGVQVMLPAGSNANTNILSALFTRQIGLSILGAMVLLFGSGMLMWAMERRSQPYFDRDAKDAGFPAFWWALNLVVNGGFEERVPQSKGGRFFAVVLVISSLFIVSIFVAQITAALTVSAIQQSIDGINDLEGRRVGTIAGSTSAEFLDRRGIANNGLNNLTQLLGDFENDKLDAVVFDGPILAYYVRTQSAGKADLLERVYRRENYGMVFPTGSDLREDMDQAILRLREDGTYDELLIKWFGAAYSRR